MIERKDSTILTSPMESVKSESQHIVSHPLDDILLWHKAIKRELNDSFEKIKKMHLLGDFTTQSDIGKSLKFIAEICIFHRYSFPNFSLLCGHLNISIIVTTSNDTYGET